MTLSIWTEDSGFNFGVYNEQVAVSIELPAIVDPLVSFSVISGYLRDGLYISNNFIIGTASLIPDDAIYKFCIRATKGSLYADRTFYLTIQSNNPLSFITESGRLNCGINGQLFTIDDTGNNALLYFLESIKYNNINNDTINKIYNIIIFIIFIWTFYIFKKFRSVAKNSVQRAEKTCFLLSINKKKYIL